MLTLVMSGCSIGSAGVIVGPFSYGTDDPSGYPSNLPFGSLSVDITYPRNGEVFFWDSRIVVTGVIRRQDMDVDEYPWIGPVWSVDFGKIGENYYFYNKTYNELWVEFILDGKIMGPGMHIITLRAWDNRDGGTYPVGDTINIVLD
jgi:hypothetical protein